MQGQEGSLFLEYLCILFLLGVIPQVLKIRFLFSYPEAIFCAICCFRFCTFACTLFFILFLSFWVSFKLYFCQYISRSDIFLWLAAVHLRYPFLRYLYHIYFLNTLPVELLEISFQVPFWLFKEVERVVQLLFPSWILFFLSIILGTLLFSFLPHL